MYMVVWTGSPFPMANHMSLFGSNARCLAALVALNLCFALPGIARTKPAPLTKREQAEHALDRLTFGPRPGDVARVETMGVERWIDQQLHPERIDDAALDAKLNALPAMRLSTEELIRRFPPPQVVRQMDAGKIAMPADPVERAVYANALANYREQRAKKAQDGMTDSAVTFVPAQNAASLLQRDPAQRWNAVLAMQPGSVRPLVQRMTAAERAQLVAGMTPQQKEVLLALVEPGRVVTEELQEEKLLRALYSERQLEEVMTNFWPNHFNIYLRKNGEMPWYLRRVMSAT